MRVNIFISVIIFCLINCSAANEVDDTEKIERTPKTYLNEEPNQNSWVKYTPRYNQVYKERHEQFMDDYTYIEPLKEEYHPNWNKLNFNYYMYYYYSNYK